MRTTYFKPCPYCGANLDPGERCECQRRNEAHAKPKRRTPRMLKSVRADAFERKEGKP